MSIAMQVRGPSDVGLYPELNMVPKGVHHIHLMGICGTGMASLAGILKEEGFLVTGSDRDIYPPMSDFLESLAITPMKGYAADNLNPRPDLVVVGNVITRDNPEAIELSRLKLPYISFPQALRYFAIREKKTIVVCGTHGKTTTSSLVAWVLNRAGMDPGFMIGGIPKNFQKNFNIDKGPYFVIEGDEYDTAFFDKGPKFLHYRPWITIITSIEFDHADIYRDFDHVVSNFRRLIGLMPPEGVIIANQDDPAVMAEVENSGCRVLGYGISENNALWKAAHISMDEDFTRLTVLKKGKEYMEISTPMYGRHNISNLLSVIVLADLLGIRPPTLSKAIRDFGGVKRRQEILGQRDGILIIDDFAHHPTAVKETISAVKQKFNDRRLIAVFEPRSNSSRRNVFQEAYASAFDDAEITMIPEPPLMDKIPPEERLSSKRLVEDLKKRSLKAFYFSNSDLLLKDLTKKSAPGDVVLFMSNGAFDNLPRRFLEGR